MGGGAEGEALAESEELEREREQRGRGGSWSSEVQAWVLPCPLRWVQGQDVSLWLGAESWYPIHTVRPFKDLTWAALVASGL